MWLGPCNHRRKTCCIKTGASNNRIYEHNAMDGDFHGGNAILADSAWFVGIHTVFHVRYNWYLYHGATQAPSLPLLASAPIVVKYCCRRIVNNGRGVNRFGLTLINCYENVIDSDLLWPFCMWGLMQNRDKELVNARTCLWVGPW